MENLDTNQQRILEMIEEKPGLKTMELERELIAKHGESFCSHPTYLKKLKELQKEYIKKDRYKRFYLSDQGKTIQNQIKKSQEYIADQLIQWYIKDPKSADNWMQLTVGGLLEKEINPSKKHCSGSKVRPDCRLPLWHSNSQKNYREKLFDILLNSGDEKDLKMASQFSKTCIYCWAEDSNFKQRFGDIGGLGKNGLKIARKLFK